MMPQAIDLATTPSTTRMAPPLPKMFADLSENAPDNKLAVVEWILRQYNALANFEGDVLEMPNRICSELKFSWRSCQLPPLFNDSRTINDDSRVTARDLHALFRRVSRLKGFNPGAPHCRAPLELTVKQRRDTIRIEMISAGGRIAALASIKYPENHTIIEWFSATENETGSGCFELNESDS